jgi:hypothetical protein
MLTEPFSQRAVYEYLAQHQSLDSMKAAILPLTVDYPEHAAFIQSVGQFLTDGTLRPDFPRHDLADLRAFVAGLVERGFMKAAILKTIS